MSKMFIFEIIGGWQELYQLAKNESDEVFDHNIHLLLGSVLFLYYIMYIHYLLTKYPRSWQSAITVFRILQSLYVSASSSIMPNQEIQAMSENFNVFANCGKFLEFFKNQT